MKRDTKYTINYVSFFGESKSIFDVLDYEGIIEELTSRHMVDVKTIVVVEQIAGVCWTLGGVK